jgi:hypothetical protein
MLPYIEVIATDQREAEKLSALGADTPQALLALIQAAPEAFSDFVGANHARDILQRLHQIVPSSEPSYLPAPPRRFGVPLTGAPSGPTKPRFNIERRDQLFDQIQLLKRSGAPESEIRRVERDLDNLLDSLADR